jgi:ABC-type sugar transport system, ATPase component
MSSLNQPVGYLSGGNQQKVVLAKLLCTKPKILLLEEPTQGIDIQAKVEIMKAIDDLTRKGVAVIIISEELHELLDICDRIIVLFNGEIKREFQMSDDGVNAELILSAVEGSF